jgi:TetR/AcrR family transcriptional regulator, regulator of mycofactocin system
MTTTSTPPSTRALKGRPVATSHAEIEQAAFRLFAIDGFEGTTLEAIAREVGVGRRTLFRYYSSKNDIPWGQFERTLEEFRRMLHEIPGDVPVHEAVHRGVLRFNEFPDGALPSHRDRMRLILTTPGLQAHSVLRYADWRQVICEYVAGRLGVSPTDLLPQTIGQVCLGLTLAAYGIWLDDESADLGQTLDRAMAGLREFLQI